MFLTKSQEKILIVLLGIIGFGGMFLLYANSPDRETERAERLAKVFGMYLDCYTDPGWTNTRCDESPYIRGKLLMVDLKHSDEFGQDMFRRAIGKDAWLELNHAEFGGLPEELQASKPSEVGTIVWVDWSRYQTGIYGLSHFTTSGGEPAYKVVCTLTFIDIRRTAVIGEKVIEGEDPPKRKPASQFPYGPRPTHEIVRYLESLPRRPLQVD